MSDLIKRLTEAKPDEPVTRGIWTEMSRGCTIQRDRAGREQEEAHTREIWVLVSFWHRDYLVYKWKAMQSMVTLIKNTFKLTHDKEGRPPLTINSSTTFEPQNTLTNTSNLFVIFVL